jgi:hypothetical protein
MVAGRFRRLCSVVEVERCLRCSAELEWRHGTWQCPGCRLKLGCCEGDAPCDNERVVDRGQSPGEPFEEASTATSSRSR